MKPLTLRYLRLQTEAFRRHGLTRDQFLKLTPAELSQLNKDAQREWLFEKEQQDRRTARLIAAIFNNNPNRKRGKVFDESHFMPRKNATGTGRSGVDLFAKVTWIHNTIHARNKLESTNGG